ncbi:MAG: hemerythrin family protein [Synergistaceae bacterium]|jgi:hemerythrin-like metal-binding protein|nr:hemerythrin family protein [Synergistaceae bacterium]
MLWNKSLELGIPAIDDQHKELFRQIDILFDRNNADRVPQTLKFLGEYVEKHFRDEQLIHIRARYPKAAPHRKLHADFVAAFKKLKEEYDKGSDKLPVLLKINKTAASWLKGHILVHDKEFAVYYKENSPK